MPSSASEDESFKGKLVEAVVCKEIYLHVFEKLCSNYQVEEKALKAVLNSYKNKAKFNPKDYGQDKALLSCSFLKTGQLLSKMNDYNTPFEKIELLKQAYKQMQLDIEEHLAEGRQIPLSGDIVIASMIAALVNGPLAENVIANMMIVEYFSYVNYNTSGVGFMVTSYIAVIEKLRIDATHNT